MNYTYNLIDAIATWFWSMGVKPKIAFFYTRFFRKHNIPLNASLQIMKDEMMKLTGIPKNRLK